MYLSDCCCIQAKQSRGCQNLCRHVVGKPRKPVILPIDGIGPDLNGCKLFSKPIILRGAHTAAT